MLAKSTFLLVLVLGSGALSAADFGFGVVIRAGRSNGNIYELGIGPAGAAPSATLDLTNWFVVNQNRNFEIGYNGVSNTAFVRLYNASGTSYQEATFAPAAGVPASPLRTWTLPENLFFVQSAAANIGTMTVEQLSVQGPGLTILQPLSATALTTVAGGGGGTIVSTSLSAPVVFRTASSGANASWMLTGRLRFDGNFSNGASPDRLRFGITANSTDAAAVPEPETFLVVGAGLILLTFIKRRNGIQPR
jgi:hypothetical protein